MRAVPNATEFDFWFFDQMEKERKRNCDAMKLERQDDAEIEKFLGQIPHATPLSFHRHECDNHRCRNLPLHHGHGHERHGHGHVGNGFFQGDGNEHKHPIHRHVNGHDDDRHGGYHHHPHHVLGGHGHGDTTNNKRTVHQLHGVNDDYPSCHGHVCVSSVTPSDGSSSSSASGRHSPEDGSPLVPPYDFNLDFPTEKSSHPNGFYFPESRDLPDSKKEVDELGLSDKLWAMGIVDNEEEESKLDPYTTQLGANNGNAVTNVPNLAMHDPARNLLMLKLKLQQHYQTSNLPGTQRSNTLFPDREPEEFMNSAWTKAKEQPANDSFTNLRLPGESGFGAAQYRPAVQVPYFTSSGHNLPLPGESGFGAAQYRPAVQVPYFTSSGHSPSITEVYLFSQPDGCDFRGDRDMFSSLNSPLFTPPNQSLGLNSYGNLLHYSLPMYTGGQGQSPQSHSTMQAPRNFETFNDEGSFILQGKYLNYVANRQRMGFSHHQLERQNSVGKNFELNYNVGHVPRPYSPFLPTRYSSLLGIQGKIYYAAKDQQGCRFLQSKVNEGAPHDVQMIFKEIIDYVTELMVNPFGNYLVQKLLEVCNKEERMQIVHVVTRQPGELVKISLNMHGTRAVQKLIETINTQQQVSLIVSALEPGFLDLIKDLNGNHVVQRCLQCLNIEDNKFIFYASAKHCVDIATHRHGCCVLQRCIAHSIGKYRENLVAEISGNGLRLAQDSFGNYVVQYILDLNNPSAAATLMSQFEGNYVHLSMQKSSSNVVEKCLHVFAEEGRSRIIHELLSTSQFDRLLQDPFANYVIQSALGASKGPLHDSLIEAIRPHAQGLRTSPYCKRIITRTLLKK